MSKFQMILLPEPLKAKAGDYLLIGEGRVVVQTPDQIASTFFNGPTIHATPESRRDISAGSFRRLRILTRDNSAFERRLWLFDRIKMEPGHMAGHYKKLAKAANPSWSEKDADNYMTRDLKALVEVEIVRHEGKTKRFSYFPVGS